MKQNKENLKRTIRRISRFKGVSLLEIKLITRTKVNKVSQLRQSRSKTRNYACNTGSICQCNDS